MYLNKKYKIILFYLLYIFMCAYLCVCVPHVHLVSTKSKMRNQILWNSCYKQL